MALDQRSAGQVSVQHDRNIAKLGSILLDQTAPRRDVDRVADLVERDLVPSGEKLQAAYSGHDPQIDFQPVAFEPFGNPNGAVVEGRISPDQESHRVVRPQLITDDRRICLGSCRMPVLDSSGVVARRAVPIGVRHLDNLIVIRSDERLANGGTKANQIALGISLVCNEEEIDLVQRRDRLPGQMIKVSGADSNDQCADSHRPPPVRIKSRSRCCSTASAKLSIMVSLRLAKEGASGWGRHAESLASATSLSQARRKPSFSRAPCHIVPQTWPTRQPSRNASARPCTRATPWWISYPATS